MFTPWLTARFPTVKHPRQRVLRDDGVPADERMPRDAAELMNPGKGADGRIVADLDVAGQRRRVGEDDPAADVGVVSDVGVGHEQVVVADPRDPAAAGGAAADRARTRRSDWRRRW